MSGPDTGPQHDELGPIDYIVVEWPNNQPNGEALPMLLELEERGIVRVIDLAVMAKDEDGTVGALDVGAFGSNTGFAALEGVVSGILTQEDLDEAAAALEPGTAAAILVWENTWAAPFAAAVRRSGGELVASGRIPVQSLIASLDAIEAATT